MSSGRSLSSTLRLTSTSTLRPSTTSPPRWQKRSRSEPLRSRSHIERSCPCGAGALARPACTTTTHVGTAASAVRQSEARRSRGILSTSTQSATQPHLIRALGRRDLVLLFVVAVFNLNVVPSIAANGGVTIWLWIISLPLFFWPQGIAVIELAHRYPGEGGVYLWAKEVFGDFHGFLSGWCYWTNNMLYVPTVMLYFVGVSVYVLGPSHQALRSQRFPRFPCIAHPAQHTRPRRREVDQ